MSETEVFAELLSQGLQRGKQIEKKPKLVESENSGENDKV